jgi:LPXTG-motif cell wall-anchored protein
MRSMRQRLAAVTLLGGLTTLGLGLTAGPASAALNTECLGIIGQAQSGSLHLTSTPAAGSDVLAGSSINVSGSWNADDYEETDRFYVCGTVNGNYSDALSSIEKPLDNDGSFSAAVALPANLPVGSDICLLGDVRGKLISGETGVDMVSENLCFRTAAEATTTTTMATTTTTMAPAVEPAVVEAGTPSAPAVEVAPVAEAPAPMPELPRTGSSIDLLAGFGGIALALGGVARFLGRRRPAEG